MFNNIIHFFIMFIMLLIELEMWDWGLGIGDWGLGPIPNPLYNTLLNFIILYFA